MKFVTYLFLKTDLFIKFYLEWQTRMNIYVPHPYVQYYKTVTTQKGVTNSWTPCVLFFKTIFKGNIFAVSEREVNSILRFWPTSWKDRTFCLVASFSARQEDHFLKMSKADLPFRFCKIGLRNTFFWQKNCCLFCCNFARFWLTLKKNRSSHRAEKDAFKRKKLFDLRVFASRNG